MEGGSGMNRLNGVWSSLMAVRERAKSRRIQLPNRIISENEIDPDVLLANAGKKVTLWAKTLEVSEHSEALEHAMQEEVTASFNRLFSPTAAAHEVHFDRGVMFGFIKLFDKLSRAKTELTKAQAELSELQRRLENVTG
jgi:hypothetical protein